MFQLNDKGMDENDVGFDEKIPTYDTIDDIKEPGIYSNHSKNQWEIWLIGEDGTPIFKGLSCFDLGSGGILQLIKEFIWYNTNVIKCNHSIDS